MPKQVFAGFHTNGNAVRVIYGRDAGDGGIGLDVLLNGILKARCFNPSEVTTWFEKNSVANKAKWQAAYHLSGLTADSFKRPAPIGDVALPVKYLSQRDNEFHPLGTCNVTSVAMDLAFLGAKRKKDSYRQFEDELYKTLEAAGRDYHAHDDLAWLMRQYGMDAHFNTNRTFAQIDAELHAGFPVIVSTVLTRAGHIVLISGKQDDNYIVQDPFGDATTGYKERNGANVLYSTKLMMAKVRNPGEPLKWAHFVRQIVK